MILSYINRFVCEAGRIGIKHKSYFDAMQLMQCKRNANAQIICVSDYMEIIFNYRLSTLCYCNEAGVYTLEKVN